MTYSDRIPTNTAEPIHAVNLGEVGDHGTLNLCTECGRAIERSATLCYNCGHKARFEREAAAAQARKLANHRAFKARMEAQ